MRPSIQSRELAVAMGWVSGSICSAFVQFRITDDGVLNSFLLVLFASFYEPLKRP